MAQNGEREDEDGDGNEDGDSAGGEQEGEGTGTDEQPARLTLTRVQIAKTSEETWVRNQICQVPDRPIWFRRLLTSSSGLPHLPPSCSPSL